MLHRILLLSAVLCSLAHVGIRPIILDEQNVPGYRSVLSQKGLDYSKGVGVQVLQKLLVNLNIPSLSGVFNEPVIGDVDWHLNDIKLISIDIGQSSVTPNPNSGITVQLSNVNGQVNSNWDYTRRDWPHISGSGSAVTKITAGATMSFSVFVSNGQPQISVTSSSVSISNLDIQISGGASWLYNLFVNVLHDQIANAISNALRSAIQDNTQDNLNNILKTVNLKQSLADHLVFDAEFIPSPTYGQNSVSIPQLGRTYVDGSEGQFCPISECSFTPLPSDPSTTKMYEVYVSEYVANSFMYAANSSGLLAYEVLPKDVPASSLFKLNTSTFSAWVPALQKLYPNTAMSIVASTTKPPLATFHPKGANVSVAGSAEFWVHPDNAPKRLVFTIIGNGTIGTAASLNGWNLVAKLGDPTFTFDLSYSSIGDFDPQTLRAALRFLLNYGIIPGINSKLAQGVSLPTLQGVSFTNPSMTWSNSYLSYRYLGEVLPLVYCVDTPPP
ncbi:bactericidal permeability-increasing protein-like [Planoprotostelium fungivorum]|uniref:Bactericidal permeability-increasing protein-like n=1 Tax=Planoprotostelium fungivorum TaxID=1890364 RepID=A0A2P6NTE2_9EUKA|nr:bactericidal permeability-increasing protein-like [Planoprotostelium fungivorum]